MHVVAVLALGGVVGLELTIPCEVFGNASRDARPLYDVRVCGPSPGIAINGVGRRMFGLKPPHPLRAAAEADTIVVPASDQSALGRPVLALLRDAHAQGVRIASICGGAFVLAEAGLLDGLRAATHWTRAAELARRYPAVRVDPAVLYVDNDNILTSAGMSAGLDMCLHMVRGDHGATVAADTARYIVMPPQRDGGQAQFIAHEEPADDQGLQPTLGWVEQNLDEPITLTDIARQAGVSARTLNRRFREQMGTTPLQWMIRQRLHRAQELLETTALPIEDVARRTGFGTAMVLRQHFKRILTTTPSGYRRTFQQPGTARHRPVQQ